MFPFRLHAKFLVLVLGVLAVFLGALSAIIVQRETRILAQKNAEAQRMLAQAVVENLRESMLEGRSRSTLNLMKRLEGSSGLVRLEVLRKDGSPVFSGKGGRQAVPELGRAFESGEEVRFQEDGAPPLNTMLFPLRNERDCRGCHRQDGPVLGVVRVSLSLDAAQREIAASRRSLIMLFSLIIAATGGVLYAVIRKLVLTPIGALRRVADAIGTGDFSRRIEVRSRDEFHDVAEAVNRMAGQLTRMYSDLGELVQARTKELDESFRLLWGIVSSMPGGVMLLDMAGRVKLINRYAAKMLRCRQEDVIDRKLSDAVPESAAFTAAAFDKADQGHFQEMEFSAPDGRRVPIGFSSTYYRGAAGGYDGLIVAFRDLSELKALQAELIDKERFAAMGRVVAGVAHEVRNPLFGISSIGQIFERELTNPAHLELVRALLSESRRLNQLVEDLLLYSRPSRLRLEPCNVRRLWRDVLEAYRDETLKKGVRIAGDDGGALPLVSLDAHQMQQVFLNLLRNALDASPPGTEIAVRFLVADQYLTFELRDEGDGIPEENRGRVFEVFFTTKPVGTGLGLAICRKIVEDHGGDIAIESAEGRGTTVTVRLPYRRTEKEAQNTNV